MAHIYKVFVYGTLKRNEPNHHWFAKDKGIFKLLGEAETVEKFPLIIGTQYNIPFLLFSPGNGHNVQGEVYEVDNSVFENLDILEDHPNFYVREEHNVRLLKDNSILKCWIYFIKDFRQNLLKQTFLNNYSTHGSHGLQYFERYLRQDDNYKVEVLSKIKHNFSENATLEDLNMEEDMKK